jgi:hypothetical protein
MEFVWVMSICVGVSSWGCGWLQRIPQPSHMVCDMEVKEFKLHTNSAMATDNGQVAYAVCELAAASKAPPHPSTWRVKE